MSINFIYTVSGYVAVTLPYRPLYTFCDFVGANKYQVYTEVPKIEPGYTRKFSLREGWSEPIAMLELPENTVTKIKTVQSRLMVYHNLLNFENSCKLRYIPLGYGNELMYSLMETDDRLLQAYADSRKSTLEAAREELKLRKQEIINMFIFLLETKKIVLDYVEQEKYEKAAEYMMQEISRMNI